MRSFRKKSKFYGRRGMRGHWFENLGVIEPEVRKTVLDAHHDMVGAQDESKMSSGGVYGQMWLKLHKSFEAMARNNGHTMQVIRVRNANYKLVTVGPYLLYPWRFSSKQVDDIEGKRFAKPNSVRSRLFALSPSSQSEPMLPFSLEGESGSVMDEILEVDSDVEIYDSYRVVIIGISSNSDSIHKLIWGEASLTENGRLKMRDSREIMMESQDTISVWDNDASFDGGDIAEIPVLRKNKDQREDSI